MGSNKKGFSLFETLIALSLSGLVVTYGGGLLFQLTGKSSPFVRAGSMGEINQEVLNISRALSKQNICEFTLKDKTFRYEVGDPDRALVASIGRRATGEDIYESLQIFNVVRQTGIVTNAENDGASEDIDTTPAEEGEEGEAPPGGEGESSAGYGGSDGETAAESNPDHASPVPNIPVAGFDVSSPLAVSGGEVTRGYRTSKLYVTNFRRTSASEYIAYFQWEIVNTTDPDDIIRREIPILLEVANDPADPENKKIIKTCKSFLAQAQGEEEEAPLVITKIDPIEYDDFQPMFSFREGKRPKPLNSTTETDNLQMFVPSGTQAYYPVNPSSPVQVCDPRHNEFNRNECVPAAVNCIDGTGAGCELTPFLDGIFVATGSNSNNFSFSTGTDDSGLQGLASAKTFSNREDLGGKKVTSIVQYRQRFYVGTNNGLRIYGQGLNSYDNSATWVSGVSSTSGGEIVKLQVWKDGSNAYLLVAQENRISLSMMLPEEQSFEELNRATAPQFRYFTFKVPGFGGAPDLTDLPGSSGFEITSAWIGHLGYLYIATEGGIFQTREQLDDDTLESTRNFNNVELYPVIDDTEITQTCFPVGRVKGSTFPGRAWKYSTSEITAQIAAGFSDIGDYNAFRTSTRCSDLSSGQTRCVQSGTVPRWIPDPSTASPPASCTTNTTGCMANPDWRSASECAAMSSCNHTACFDRRDECRSFSCGASVPSYCTVKGIGGTTCPSSGGSLCFRKPRRVDRNNYSAMTASDGPCSKNNNTATVDTPWCENNSDCNSDENSGEKRLPGKYIEDILMKQQGVASSVRKDIHFVAVRNKGLWYVDLNKPLTDRTKTPDSSRAVDEKEGRFYRYDNFGNPSNEKPGRSNYAYVKATGLPDTVKSMREYKFKDGIDLLYVTTLNGLYVSTNSEWTDFTRIGDDEKVFDVAIYEHPTGVKRLYIGTEDGLKMMNGRDENADYNTEFGLRNSGNTFSDPSPLLSSHYKNGLSDSRIEKILIAPMGQASGYGAWNCTVINIEDHCADEDGCTIEVNLFHETDSMDQVRTIDTKMYLENSSSPLYDPNNEGVYGWTRRKQGGGDRAFRLGTSNRYQLLGAWGWFYITNYEHADCYDPKKGTRIGTNGESFTGDDKYKIVLKSYSFVQTKVIIND